MNSFKFKICFVIIILIFAMFTCNNYTYATTLNDKINQADATLNEGDDSFQLNETTIKESSNVLFSVITGIGILVAVIWGGRIAIGFMIAGAEDKANYKEQLVPYVIGMIVLFGAFTIWKIVLEFLKVLN